jgi:hypothetical protein
LAKQHEAIWGARNILEACWEDSADIADETHKEAARKACRETGDIVDMVAGVTGKSKDKIKKSDIYRLLEEGAEDETFAALKTCDRSSEEKVKKCEVVAKEMMAKAKGMDPSRITDNMMKKAADAGFARDFSEKVMACMDNSTKTKTACMGELKDAVKQRSFDASAEMPSMANMLKHINRASVTAVKEIGKACSVDDTMSKQRCFDKVKEHLAKSKGKSTVSDYEASAYQHNAAMEEAMEAHKACVAAKKDNPAATCDDFFEIARKMKGDRTEATGKQAKINKQKLVQDVGAGLMTENRQICFEDTSLDKAGRKVCLTKADQDSQEAVDQLTRGKPQVLKEKLQKQYQRDADRKIFGEQFSACMAGKKPDDWDTKMRQERAEDIKSGSQACMVELKAEHDKGGAEEKPESMVGKLHASIFEDVASQACTETKQAAKACRDAAKARAQDAGLEPRKIFKFKKLGEVRAAAKVWAACLEAEEAECEAEALAEYKAVAGTEDGWPDKTRAHVETLAIARVEGEVTEIKTLPYIDVTGRLDSATCADQLLDDFKAEVGNQGAVLTPSIGSAGETVGRVVDAQCEVTSTVDANDLPQDKFEAHSEQLATGMTGMEMDDGQVRRLVQSTVVETGASQNSVECAESDSSCNTATAPVSSTTAAAAPVSSTTAAVDPQAGTTTENVTVSQARADSAGVMQPVSVACVIALLSMPGLA